MNRHIYAKIIRQKFPRWIREDLGGDSAPLLVQHHERCLWTKESRDAMEESGILLIENYPKCPQDLNPIETVWRELRAWLADTEPPNMETRAMFIARLRLAVQWVNRSRADLLQSLSRSQKKRALDVLEAKGARTEN